MGVFNHARYQIWAILFVAGLTTSITTLHNGGRLEVDLLFPSNSTYTPQALMPIVFAVQNPTLLSQFRVGIDWSLWKATTRLRQALW
jgi:hypothetical protein